MPHLRTEQFGAGNHKWLVTSHGINDCVTVALHWNPTTPPQTQTPFIDQLGRDYIGYLPAGTPLDVSDFGDAALWTGTGRLGFLFTDQPIWHEESDGSCWVNVPALLHGTIKVPELPARADGSAYPAWPAEGAFIFVGAEAPAETGGAA